MEDIVYKCRLNTLSTATLILSKFHVLKALVYFCIAMLKFIIKACFIVAPAQRDVGAA